MLKLRSIGLSDYSVLEGRQRIGRIRSSRHATFRPIPSRRAACRSHRDVRAIATVVTAVLAAHPERRYAAAGASR